VEAAREALGRLNPAVQVVGLRERIGSGNVAALAAGAALLIDCLDNFQTRHVLNAYAVQARRPLLHAGVSGLCGQITLLHPPHTACLACLVPAAPPAESPPILGATAGLLGCLQAMEALKFLTGTGSSLLGRLLFCDGEAMRFEEVRLERDPDCPVCGGPGRRRRGP
jgi:molybdopterin/thiamine biosynthesis adenylyltransferase